MNLAYVRGNYEFHTGKVSELTRQLAFAGLAIVWLFKTGQDGAFKFPTTLFSPLLLLVITLSLDWLHYAVAAFVWDRYQDAKEKSGTKDEDEFEAPGKINWPANVFFYLKQVTLVAAYVLLLSFAFKAWALL